jgi:quercetin dioxygenase-like cupin family protein
MNGSCSKRTFNILQSKYPIGGYFTHFMDGQSIKSSETRSYPASRQRGETTAFWRSSRLSGVGFFKASFTAAHVFSRHTHDEYAIAVVERGAPTFACRRAARLAPTGSFLLINPDEPHEGRSANDRSYRMMYVEPNALSRLLESLQANTRTSTITCPPSASAKPANWSKRKWALRVR